MSSIEATRLLMQMRQMSLDAAGAKPNVAPTAGAAQPQDFARAIKSAMADVNELQVNAQQLATSFESGVAGVDITRVMLEVQKAGLAFRAMTEVRNKLVVAYQEVMNMPM
jgi:flagellar hook-basal body complex protein FliE